MAICSSRVSAVIVRRCASGLMLSTILGSHFSSSSARALTSCLDRPYHRIASRLARAEVLRGGGGTMLRERAGGFCRAEFHRTEKGTNTATARIAADVTEVRDLRRILLSLLLEIR